MTRLAKLAGMKNIALTCSGNHAILVALHQCKLWGKTEVLIPKDGGWYSYKHYPQLLGMTVKTVETNWALLDLKDLKAKLGKNSVLLYSIFGGYFVEEPVEEIAKLAKKAGALVIGDISSSIGLEFKGFDYAVCSFGLHKPLEVGFGGMVCSNSKIETPLLTLCNFPEAFNEALTKAVKNLGKRWQFFKQIRNEIMVMLARYGEIAHPSSRGIDLVIKGQPKPLLEFCAANKLPFMLCPRYHRVNEKAVSIEIKRLSPPEKGKF